MKHIYIYMCNDVWTYMTIYTTHICIYDNETIVFDNNYSNLLPVPGRFALLFLYILDDFRVSDKL